MSSTYQGQISERTLLHRTAQITRAELDAEAAEVYSFNKRKALHPETIKPTDPNTMKFCCAPYVGYACCERKEGHEGEHAVTGNTGRIIGWDQKH